MTRILVNDKQWEALTSEEQKKIEEGLRKTGAIGLNDTIHGDPSAPPFDENTQLDPRWNPIRDACKAACDVTASAAAAWCVANTAGVALAVCLAAAEAGRSECHKRC